MKKKRNHLQEIKEDKEKKEYLIQENKRLKEEYKLLKKKEELSKI